MPKKFQTQWNIFLSSFVHVGAWSGFWNIPLMHINLFSRTIFMIFLMSFPSLFCRYDQYLEKKLEHWKRILECPAAIPERQMFEYSQLRSLLTLTAERLFGDYQLLLVSSLLRSATASNQPMTNQEIDHFAWELYTA